MENFEKIVMEVGKRMRQEKFISNESLLVKLTNTIAAVDKSGKLEKFEYDGRISEQHFGSYSLKLIEYQNAKTVQK